MNSNFIIFIYLIKIKYKIVCVYIYIKLNELLLKRYIKNNINYFKYFPLPP